MVAKSNLGLTIISPSSSAWLVVSAGFFFLACWAVLSELLGIEEGQRRRKDGTGELQAIMGDGMDRKPGTGQCLKCSQGIMFGITRVMAHGNPPRLSPSTLAMDKVG